MGLGFKGGHIVARDSHMAPGPGAYDTNPNEISKAASQALSLSQGRGRNSVGN